MPDEMDVVVVGGGIAGLAAAHRLEAGLPGVRAALVERSRLGGWIWTERVEGYAVEAGPDSFLSTKPRGVGLSSEVGLGGELLRVNEITRQTFVMRGGRLHPLPEGLSGLVPARLGPMFRSSLLSPRGKARVALEAAVRARRGRGDESLGSFMRRRFGGEAYERLIEPLMSGIYGGNGDELSILATFPQLRALEIEHGSVLRGVRRSTRPLAGARPPSPFVTPRHGMASLPAAIRRCLGRTSVMEGSSVIEISRTRGGFDLGLDGGRTLRSRALILATPAFVSTVLLSPLDPDLADLHATIPYGSTITVSLGYAAGKIQQESLGHGYIIPRREARPVMAVTFSSRKFAQRAPDGALLARGFIRVGGERDRLAQNDGQLVDMVREELQETCGITADPAVSRVFRLPNSMPQYAVGHTERVSAIGRRLRSLPGLFVAGAAYSGVGIPDCIVSGESAAEAASAYLNQ